MKLAISTLTIRNDRTPARRPSCSTGGIHARSATEAPIAYSSWPFAADLLTVVIIDAPVYDELFDLADPLQAAGATLLRLAIEAWPYGRRETA